MFNYQSLGDNMSALRANQKTQVLILHRVYLKTNVRYNASLLEELKLGFLMRSVKNSVACLSGELVCGTVASYTSKGFEIIG